MKNNWGVGGFRTSCQTVSGYAARRCAAAVPSFHLLPKNYDTLKKNWITPCPKTPSLSRF